MRLQAGVACVAWGLVVISAGFDGLLIALAARSDPTWASQEKIAARIMYLAVSLIGATVGLLIASHRSRNAVGWLVLISTLSAVLARAADDYARYGPLQVDSNSVAITIAGWLAILFLAPMYSSLWLLFLLFPSGRLVSRHWRPLAGGIVAAAVVPVAASLAYRGPRTGVANLDFSQLQPVAVSQALVLPEPFSTALAAIFPYPLIGLIPTAYAICLFSQATRYRRAASHERQQIKWIVYAVCVGVAIYALQAIEAFGMWSGAVGNLAYLTMAVAVGLAVLRTRLFDIDRLIVGTLAFGALWLAITGVYLGLTSTLGVAIVERVPIVWAIGGTIGAAVLFQPARLRLEGLADRWVFGERLGGYDLLARFGATVQQTVEPAELAVGLARSVRPYAKWLPGDLSSIRAWSIYC